MFLYCIENHSDKYENNIFNLPKHPDERVAKLHIGKISVGIDILTKEEAEYISVGPERPYKPKYYI